MSTGFSLARRRLRQAVDQDPGQLQVLKGMARMLGNLDGVVTKEFVQICSGLGACVTPAQAAEVWKEAAPAGVAPIELVLQLLLGADKASIVASSVRGGPLHTNRDTRPFTSHSWKSAKRSNRSARGGSISRGSPLGTGLKPTVPPLLQETKLPWQQRQNMSLLPESHRAFLSATKPGSIFNKRCDSAIADLYAGDTAQSGSKASKTLTLDKPMPHSWAWPSQYVLEKKDSDENRPTTKQSENRGYGGKWKGTCLLHRRPGSVRGGKHTSLGMVSKHPGDEARDELCAGGVCT